MAGGHRKKSGRYYVRARAGNGARIEVRMLGVTTDAQADVRADQIARVVGALDEWSWRVEHD